MAYYGGYSARNYVPSYSAVAQAGSMVGNAMVEDAKIKAEKADKAEAIKYLEENRNAIFEEHGKIRAFAKKQLEDMGVQDADTVVNGYLIKPARYDVDHPAEYVDRIQKAMAKMIVDNRDVMEKNKAAQGEKQTVDAFNKVTSPSTLKFTPPGRKETVPTGEMGANGTPVLNDRGEPASTERTRMPLTATISGLPEAKYKEDLAPSLARQGLTPTQVGSAVKNLGSGMQPRPTEPSEMDMLKQDKLKADLANTQARTRDLGNKPSVDRQKQESMNYEQVTDMAAKERDTLARQYANAKKALTEMSSGNFSGIFSKPEMVSELQSSGALNKSKPLDAKNVERAVKRLNLREKAWAAVHNDGSKVAREKVNPTDAFKTRVADKEIDLVLQEFAEDNPNIAAYPESATTEQTYKDVFNLNNPNLVAAVKQEMARRYGNSTPVDYTAWDVQEVINQLLQESAVKLAQGTQGVRQSNEWMQTSHAPTAQVIPAQGGADTLARSH